MRIARGHARRSTPQPIRASLMQNAVICLIPLATGMTLDPCKRSRGLVPLLLRQGAVRPVLELRTHPLPNASLPSSHRRASIHQSGSNGSIFTTRVRREAATGWISVRHIMVARRLWGRFSCWRSGASFESDVCVRTGGGHGGLVSVPLIS